MSLRDLIRRFPPAAIFLTVTAFIYLAFSTSFVFAVPSEPYRTRDYFAMQADAFLHGHTWLNVPRPFWDMSFYHARTYLYWEPVNALPQLLARLATGHYVYNGYFKFLWCLLGVCIFWRILRYIDQRYLHRPSNLLGIAFALCLAFGTPLLVLVAEPASPYVESISLSFALQMASCLLALVIVQSDCRRWRYLFGLCLSLGIGARLTNVLHAFACFCTVGLLVPSPRLRNAFQKLRVPAAIIAATIAAILIYNQIRFDSPLETGQDYQMLRDKTYKEMMKAPFVSPRWFTFNAYLYLAHPPHFRSFPFKVEERAVVDVPPRIQSIFMAGLPFKSEVNSVFLMMPLLLLVVLLPFARPTPNTVSLALGFTLMFLIQLALLLCYAWAFLRFMNEFIPAWLVVAYIGTRLFMERHPKSVPVVWAFVAAACVYSTGIYWFLAYPNAVKDRHALLAKGLTHISWIPWSELLLLLLGLAATAEIYGAIARRQDNTG